MGGRSQTGAGDLLELVRSGRAVTRGALQQATGLSRATVGQRLDRLFRAGWLREGAGGPVDSPLGGRPSITLEFDDAHAVVLAADLETRHARAAVLSLTGEILAEHSGTLVIEDGPDAVLGELGRWFAELLEKAGHRAEEACGIGLAVPGPVDLESGRVVQPPIMPGWDGYDIRGRLARSFTEHTGAGPVPVLVDNDANLMAYGEQRTAYPDCSAFVLVKVSTGIGAGVVVDGSVYRGIDGGAGDLGHIRVPAGAEALCRCGSYGCLAAVASGGAVARRLAAAGVPAASGSDVRDLLASGHPEAAALAREAGRHVGDVLATVVTLLNPGVLMIAGDLAGTPFLTGVRELLYQRALPRSTARLEVVTSRLGERAGLVGAGALVVEHLYAPERVEERLLAMGV
ncbi:putative NBD/HSP70 family sugar kinase [Streptomyces sp. SAI-208]|uniref:ROK family transcriptional regulator n=1 Tax=unclassified Streptomyces TaxID=2593676 RepID=UPI0024740EBB|nr:MULTISPECIES: ROK family protein [unclassified Streptomyces]MDH6519215.1 putative NBD/HSP70 family sugar kinase [Streptomyces sp. SAI-090]MDH6584513.1 putative NBD/HSP70 family sugar kinase [Streptomyces sp. SAI-133]MDH6610060.1 putative NBD/HSP70 family sugar kinase [Streptomyces sp. SAI-208]MDH6616692.1 putative NBD/HSP70 family sugar kinase [Streptomyces sp. SAI-135]